MGSVDLNAVFREAVHDLAAEPTPTNVRRYLAASRLLDSPVRSVSPVRPRPARVGARR
jgi:hypothetical protein